MLIDEVGESCHRVLKTQTSNYERGFSVRNYAEQKVAKLLHRFAFDVLFPNNCNKENKQSEVQQQHLWPPSVCNQEEIDCLLKNGDIPVAWLDELEKSKYIV